MRNSQKPVVMNRGNLAHDCRVWHGSVDTCLVESTFSGTVCLVCASAILRNSENAFLHRTVLESLGALDATDLQRIAVSAKAVAHDVLSAMLECALAAARNNALDVLSRVVEISPVIAWRMDSQRRLEFDGCSASGAAFRASQSNPQCSSSEQSEIDVLPSGTLLSAILRALVDRERVDFSGHFGAYQAQLNALLRMAGKLLAAATTRSCFLKQLPPPGLSGTVVRENSSGPAWTDSVIRFALHTTQEYLASGNSLAHTCIEILRVFCARPEQECYAWIQISFFELLGALRGRQNDDQRDAVLRLGCELCSKFPGDIIGSQVAGSATPRSSSTCILPMQEPVFEYSGNRKPTQKDIGQKGNASVDLELGLWSDRVELVSHTVKDSMVRANSQTASVGHDLLTIVCEKAETETLKALVEQGCVDFAVESIRQNFGVICESNSKRTAVDSSDLKSWTERALRPIREIASRLDDDVAGKSWIHGIPDFVRICQHVRSFEILQGIACLLDSAKPSVLAELGEVSAELLIHSLIQYHNLDGVFSSSRTAVEILESKKAVLQTIVKALSAFAQSAALSESILCQFVSLLSMLEAVDQDSIQTLAFSRTILNVAASKFWELGQQPMLDRVAHVIWRTWMPISLRKISDVISCMEHSTPRELDEYSSVLSECIEILLLGIDPRFAREPNAASGLRAWIWGTVDIGSLLRLRSTTTGIETSWKGPRTPCAERGVDCAPNGSGPQVPATNQSLDRLVQRLLAELCSFSPPSQEQSSKCDRTRWETFPRNMQSFQEALRCTKNSKELRDALQLLHESIKHRANPIIPIKDCCGLLQECVLSACKVATGEDAAMILRTIQILRDVDRTDSYRLQFARCPTTCAFIGRHAAELPQDCDLLLCIAAHGCNRDSRFQCLEQVAEFSHRSGADAPRTLSILNQHLHYAPALAKFVVSCVPDGPVSVVRLLRKAVVGGDGADARQGDEASPDGQKPAPYSMSDLNEQHVAQALLRAGLASAAIHAIESWERHQSILKRSDAESTAHSGATNSEHISNVIELVNETYRRAGLGAQHRRYFMAVIDILGNDLRSASVSKRVAGARSYTDPGPGERSVQISALRGLAVLFNEFPQTKSEVTDTNRFLWAYVTDSCAATSVLSRCASCADYLLKNIAYLSDDHEEGRYPEMSIQSEPFAALCLADYMTRVQTILPMSRFRRALAEQELRLQQLWARWFSRTVKSQDFVASCLQTACIRFFEAGIHLQESQDGGPVVWHSRDMMLAVFSASRPSHCARAIACRSFLVAWSESRANSIFSMPRTLYSFCATLAPSREKEQTQPASIENIQSLTPSQNGSSRVVSTSGSALTRKAPQAKKTALSRLDHSNGSASASHVEHIASAVPDKDSSDIQASRRVSLSRCEHWWNPSDLLIAKAIILSAPHRVGQSAVERDD